MTEPSYVEELRLTRFKSFRDAVVPLRDLTLVIGRNGSGKSNALDALEALARLAAGEDLRDALEDRGRVDALRGGVEGAPPRGETEFCLGCRVRTGDEVVDLEVTVQVEPTVQVVREVLTDVTRSRTLLTTVEEVDRGRADVEARYYNGKRGRNPHVVLRASRLLTAQVPTRVPATTAPLREVHRAAEQVLAALQAVFVLDPVPQLMRGYVNEKDVDLHGRGENLSAVVADLRRSQPDAFQQLLTLLRLLPEQRVTDLQVERTALGDVMIMLNEQQGGRTVQVPARLMSDGMLRFLAFVVALLDSPLLGEPSSTAGAEEAEGQRLLVIEEIENGLHPSRAEEVLEILQREILLRRVRVLATTHSPALLDALSGDDHDGVVVCDRDEDGFSRMQRLVELPGYARMLARGRLGTVTARGLMVEASKERAVRTDAFDALLEAG